MKILWLLAGVLALVGIAQAFEKGPYRHRHSTPSMALKAPSSNTDMAQRSFQSSSARLQKLFWVPSYDYRDRPIWT